MLHCLDQDTTNRKLPIKSNDPCYLLHCLDQDASTFELCYFEPSKETKNSLKQHGFEIANSE